MALQEAPHAAEHLANHSGAVIGHPLDVGGLLRDPTVGVGLNQRRTAGLGLVNGRLRLRDAERRRLRLGLREAHRRTLELALRVPLAVGGASFALGHLLARQGRAHVPPEGARQPLGYRRRIPREQSTACRLAVLLISSEAEELVEGSDRIVVLKDGRIADLLGGYRMTEDELIWGDRR